MRTLKLILIKELKSMIRDPKILIAMILAPILITGILYGIVIGLSQQMAAELRKTGGTVILVDLDKGNWSTRVREIIEEEGYRVIEAGGVDEAIDMLRKSDTLGVIVVPKGFSDNITSLKPARLETITAIRGLSMLALMKTGKIGYVVSSLSENITGIILEERGIPRNFTEGAVQSESMVLLKNNIIQAEDAHAIIGGIMMTSIMIPIIILILAGLIAQLSATSIAVEKEEKMLETLLSLPLNRMHLIAGKILASAIVGLIGLVLYGGLITWYFSSLAGMGGGTASSTGVSTVLSSIMDAVGGFTITALMVSMIGLVLFVLGIAILLALFAEDVRSAQIVSSYITMPLVFMLFVVLFIDVSSMPQTTRLVLAFIPMVNTMLIIPLGYIGDTTSITIAMFSTLAYSVVIMWVAARMITTEKVFTLRLFKRRRKGFRLSSGKR